MPAHSRTLILIDGFAGSGKSTLAQSLWLYLVRGGHDAAWYHEHESPHPIFEYGEVEELLTLAPGPFEERILAGWQAFVNAPHPSNVRIVEGAFLQIPVGVMVSMNASAVRIRALLRRIDATTAGHTASLIHLFRPDVRGALHQIGAIRGARWLEEMTAVVARSAYGQRHRVRTFDGLVKFYERQRAIIDSALPELTVRRVALDTGAGRWDRCEPRAARFVGVRRVTAAAFDTAALLRHVGSYTSASGCPCVITTDNRTLYIQLPDTHALPLVPVTSGHFCPQSLPIDIRFSYDKQGRAKRFNYESRMGNEVLSETSWTRV